MARKFLYAIALLIVLAFSAMFALRVWSDELAAIALVPTGEFEPQKGLADNAYENPDMWFSRPGIAPRQDPARWQPRQAAGTAAQSPPRFAVFFIHPTSHFDRSHWNAPLEDRQSRDHARLLLQGMASAFGQASEIWAPRYRQATFGAFLTEAPEGRMAQDAAYRDVALAFDYFVASIGADTPIVLAGHSQGSLHVMRLLSERIAGTALQIRIAMAYPVGWPISIAHDLPALPLPACATATQTGCIVSWTSFAEPADSGTMLQRLALSRGLDGQVRGDGPILCVNPITGTANGAAPAAENLGTLVPNEELTDGEIIPGAVPARCDRSGRLLIGDPPEMGPYVLPGNNYHVYDIPLFWRNLQQDVVQRLSQWAAARP